MSESLTNDDLVHVLAGQQGQAALMEVHQRQVGATPLRDVFIAVGDPPVGSRPLSAPPATALVKGF